MICPNCKKDFEKNGAARKYCSDYCRVYFASNNLKQETISRRKRSRCIQCNKIMYKVSKQHVFCSSECQRNKRNRLRLVQPLVREYFLERANFMCEECGVSNDNNLEIHHIIPLYKGGGDEVDNLAVLCDKCHRKKHKIF